MQMRTIQREIVGAFIFSNDGHILLGKSQPGGVYPGYSMIPGGGIDDGESKLDAVIREVLEEVSLDIKDAHIELVNDAQYGQSEKTLRDTNEKVLVHMHFNDFRVAIDKPASAINVQSADDFADAA
jgi:8-oxo-dGTP pyrophosphatase MutT (NUDIX family)